MNSRPSTFKYLQQCAATPEGEVWLARPNGEKTRLLLKILWKAADSPEKRQRLNLVRDSLRRIVDWQESSSRFPLPPLLIGESEDCLYYAFPAPDPLSRHGTEPYIPATLAGRLKDHSGSPSRLFKYIEAVLLSLRQFEQRGLPVPPALSESFYFYKGKLLPGDFFSADSSGCSSSPQSLSSLAALFQQLEGILQKKNRKHKAPLSPFGQLAAFLQTELQQNGHPHFTTILDRWHDALREYRRPLLGRLFGSPLLLLGLPLLFLFLTGLVLHFRFSGCPQGLHRQPPVRNDVSAASGIQPLLSALENPQLPQEELRQLVKSGAYTTTEDILFALRKALDMHQPRENILLLLENAPAIREILAERGAVLLPTAIRTRDPQLCGLLLNYGAPLLPDAQGKTPLMLAAEMRQDDLVREFLGRESNPNARDLAGRSVLHYLHPQSPTLTQELIAKGANPNLLTDYGESPLLLGIRQRLPLFHLQTLLEQGADPSLPDHFGNTPLSEAVLQDNLPALKLLTDFHANLLQPLPHARTLLHLAVFYHRPDVAKWLLAHQVPVNAPDASGRTALHWAALKNSPEMVRILLETHADTMGKDACGFTPAELAGIADAVQVIPLLPATALSPLGEDIRQLLRKVTAAHTPLPAKKRQALQDLLRDPASDHAVILAMLEGMPDLTPRSPQDQDLVRLAVEKRDNQPWILQSILAAAPPLDIPDAAGVTPLLRAVTLGDAGTIRILCAQGADLEAKDKRGRGCLDIAKEQADPRIFHLLSSYLYPPGEPGGAASDMTPEAFAAQCLRTGNASALASILRRQILSPNFQYAPGEYAIFYPGLTPQLLFQLLRHGASIFLPHNDSRTILPFFLQNNAPWPTIRVLLEHGAFPEISTTILQTSPRHSVQLAPALQRLLRFYAGKPFSPELQF